MEKSPVAPQQQFQALFKKVPQFYIDAQGTFKYIQVECISGSNKKSVTIVRGRGGDFEYHKEIFFRLLEEFVEAGFTVSDVKKDGDDTLREFKIKCGDDTLTLRCPGGGRMVHNGTARTLEVYGYSITYAVKNKIKHDEAVRQAQIYLGYPKNNIFISNKKY